MTQSRVQYIGSLHHVMSRGYERRRILEDPADKDYLVHLLRIHAKRTGMEIIAWCILDNHYHLIIRNRGDRLTDFMRSVNGAFGRHYRRRYGGAGYVFEGRYRSSVIEDDAYLLMAVGYLLLNPLRAGLVDHPCSYPYCSAPEFFSGMTFPDILTTTELVESMISDPPGLEELLENSSRLGRPQVHFENWGEVLGSHSFRFRALEYRNRRKTVKRGQAQHRRSDRVFRSVRGTIRAFCQEFNLNPGELKSPERRMARLRGELAHRLRELCGLKYAEIHKLTPFRAYRLSSLPNSVRNARKRLPLNGLNPTKSQM